jgi:hypothetical protein
MRVLASASVTQAHAGQWRATGRPRCRAVLQPLYCGQPVACGGPGPPGYTGAGGRPMNALECI